MTKQHEQCSDDTQHMLWTHLSHPCDRTPRVAAVAIIAQPCLALILQDLHSQIISHDAMLANGIHNLHRLNTASMAAQGPLLSSDGKTRVSLPYDTMTGTAYR